MLEALIWDFGRQKEIHVEMEKHVFGKRVLAGPAETVGQEEC